MAGEYGINGPSSSSSNADESYIGNFISLISKYEIRYEGVLYLLNIEDSTIGLKNVRSYGTEGRRKDGPQVPPSDKVYEYILFRGKDIKDLQVKSASAIAEEQIYSDPAIIQSQHCGMPLSSPLASVGGRRWGESIQRQDAMTSRAVPVGLPTTHPSVSQLSPSDHSCATQVAGQSSFPSPMYQQGQSGISNISTRSPLQSSPSQPLSTVSPSIMQNQMQTPATQASIEAGWTIIPESCLPVSSGNASSFVNMTCSPPSISLPISDSLDIPSFLSTKTTMPYTSFKTPNGSNMASFSSDIQDINYIDGQISGRTSPEKRPTFAGQSIRHSASSLVNSASGSLLTPSLLTLDQFSQPRPHFFSSAQNLTHDQKGMGTLTPTSFIASVSVPSSASQAPLLPLPTALHKYQYPAATQFTEEFDFVAMNEKFKKDEVWGSLGKVADNIKAVEEGNASHYLGITDCQGPILNSEPAYKKDDFFDTISCNSLTRGLRNGQNRFSERMKLDAETFGNFQRRPNIGHGNHGAGRGENFRGPHNWRRGYGYGYGRRGRGKHLPF